MPRLSVERTAFEAERDPGSDAGVFWFWGLSESKACALKGADVRAQAMSAFGVTADVISRQLLPLWYLNPSDSRILERSFDCILKRDGF